jgi:hypothetical protein
MSFEYASAKHRYVHEGSTVVGNFVSRHCDFYPGRLQTTVDAVSGTEQCLQAERPSGLHPSICCTALSGVLHTCTPYCVTCLISNAAPARRLLDCAYLTACTGLHADFWSSAMSGPARDERIQKPLPATKCGSVICQPNPSDPDAERSGLLLPP